MKDHIAKFYQAISFKKWLVKTHVRTHSIEWAPSVTDDQSETIDHIEECLNGRVADDVLVSDPKYISWLNEHPSALSSYQEMMAAAKGKRVVVFLDYDGTLSPIVDDPDRAFMSDAMRSAVHEVAKRYPTAIITGRSRDKVYEFVKLDEVYYAGSHGMDIMGPSIQLNSYDGKYQTKALDKKGNELTIFQPAQEFLPAIKKMLNELQEKTRKIHGTFIEDNRFCISVHFRHVKKEDHNKLEQIVKSILSKYRRFRRTWGIEVMEIRPSIEWNKGNALLYLLDTLGFANSDDVLPFYIGDDKTDEDAFKVLRSRGQGHPIIVSSSPRETMASYSLRDTSEVLSFLLRLAMWKEKCPQ